MLNKLEAFLRRYQMLSAGDDVICAVSGGADSVALLFAMYLLRDKLGITVSAAHFNHGLRSAESDRDEVFVRNFCRQYDITLHVAAGEVKSGKKGLEAAAREARYAFLQTLPGMIATAHTANDNAETVLMHMVRGTGLRGLGGIAPVNGKLIRPMLEITRQEVIMFLEEYHLSYVTDSSNETDQFLRNRLRHYVMPVLEQENPQLAQNMSAMALRLRQDEIALWEMAEQLPVRVNELRGASAAVRSRALACFLESCGVPEPESEHIAMAEKLVFSDKPSARASFPGGITIQRNYDILEKVTQPMQLQTVALVCPSEVELSALGLRVTVKPAKDCQNTADSFAVVPQGALYLRSRQAGDTMRLPGGTKELKKLFIDRKIPAASRKNIPVIADDAGVVAVYGIGINLDRTTDELPAVRICIENL